MDSLKEYFAIIFLFASIEALPINNSRNVFDSQPSFNSLKIMNFMRKFGYLESSYATTSETLYHEETVIAAIKNMQKYGGLNESGVLDNATLKLLTAPRCGVPDIPRTNLRLTSNRVKRFLIGSRGWTKRRITYYIANWSPKVGEDKVAAGMAQAFELWAKYSHLRFQRVFQPDADIIVVFGSGYHGDYFPFDGPGSILAHAFYPHEMASFAGDIHFDEDENWKENASSLAEGVDFRSVAVHELGHSLGLAHSPIFSSIMFPYYKGPQESKDLGYDDVMAMYELYIKNGVYDDDEEQVTTKQEVDIDGDEEKTTKATTTSTTVKKTTTATTESTVSEKSVDFATDSIVLTAESSESTTIPSTQTTIASDCRPALENTHRFSFSVGCEYPKRSGVHSSPLNLCENPRYDAIALLRGEIFIFKNEYVWRLNDEFRVLPGYPSRFSDMFQGLPDYVRHIDAAYERKTDGAIILFHGKQFWVFDGNSFIENSPRPTTQFGFDEHDSKVDAAMVWSKNGATYLFSKTKYMRYDEEHHRHHHGYPKNISEKWHGIPNNIDAVTSMNDGKTYFFKGDLYWSYNNHWIRPEHGYPRRTSIAWLGCPSQ